MGAGCDSPSKPNKGDDDPPDGEAVTVTLPPSPNFDEGKAPVQWEDGTYSIYGLRKDIDKHVAMGDVGEDVEVKGYVQDIYIPPECPEGETCPNPKQPHLWITDKPDEKGHKRSMMVVNYRFSIPEWDVKRWRRQPDVVLEKGQRYTFKGKFRRFSTSGFASDRGLLEFTAYRPHDPDTGTELDEWVYPPGAPWHPLELERIDASNQREAERARRNSR